ncbi:MAG: LysR family transcriptional regulator [Proteobacteria bacterium]|nr:LysR family transcriptional regulator [Pseudomonadota bacterium]
MDLWQLHIFCKVIELKGFSKAGQAVHLSQPTISSHIKDLENHFECQLIDRMGKEALPTKAGELLYGYARRLIALKEETETAMAEFQGMIKGRLVIGGSTIPGGYLLPKLIGAFTNQHPDVTVALIIGDTKKIIEDTLSGELEAGVVGAESSDKRIVQNKLIEDEMQLIVPADHKWADKNHIKLEMLFKEPFIIREHGSGTLQSINHSLMKKGYTKEDLSVIAEMGSTQAVIQGIKSKLGISILSTIAITEELQAGTLKALAVQGLDLKRSFYLTRNQHRSTSPLCKAFIKFLENKFIITSDYLH